MGSYEYSLKYMSLAQLRNLLLHRHKVLSPRIKKLNYSETIKHLERLRRRGLDLNYAVPSDAPVPEDIASDLLGCTALHFAADTFDEQIINYLIQNGAKITTINELGYSPIRLALQKLFDESEKWSIIKQLSNKAVLDMLLNGQYNQNDASNPSCKLGISHLHIACMVDNARMVEFLLRSGASPDAAISQDLPEIAGFRPLHVAVYCHSTDSLKLLLKGGADLFAREARGLNPLQLLVEDNLKLAALNENYLANDEMAIAMLDHCAKNFFDEYGFSRLHLAASMRDDAVLVDLLKNNPDINVNAAISSSPVQWSGYTPLHFAARCGPNAVKLLVEKGANLLIADAQGTTPFDICVIRYNKPEIIFEIMQSDETLKNLTFKASPLATLSEAINALRSTKCMDEFQRKMNHIDDPLPSDSPLWPGYTLLHLLCDKFSSHMDILEHLIEIGANPLAQDIRNSSPVHLAFRRGSTYAVVHLLEQVVKKFKRFENVTDLDGLSLLHISAAGGFNDVADSLLKNNADVNIRTISRIKFTWNKVEDDFPPGSTPLHFAAATNSSTIDLLIQKGADVLAVDSDGFTPVLRSNTWKDYDSTDSFYQGKNALLLKTLETDVVSVAGLSHLHLACEWNCTTAVKALLDGGADINAKINSECTGTHSFKESLLKKYAGYTPLHFAVEFESYYTINLLMMSGADLHARNARGLSPLHMALYSDSINVKIIIRCLLTNMDKFSCEPLDDYGFTLLYVACRFVETNWTKKLLLRGADPKAQIAKHSPIFPGDTPLNVLTDRLLKSNELQDKQLFLDNINLLTTHGAVPGKGQILAITRYLYDPHRVSGEQLRNYWTIYLNNNLLQNYDRSLDIHLACTANNIELVTELLSYGADINQPIDYFDNDGGGDRPLHIAIKYGTPNMLQLLIEKGANLSAENAYGKTAFHCLCDNAGIRYSHSYFEQVIPTFGKRGLNINAHDVTGSSPLQLLLESYLLNYQKCKSEYEKIFAYLLKCGARLNNLDSTMLYLVKANIKGLSINFLRNKAKYDTDILAVMDDGSTAIHNAVRGEKFTDGYEDKVFANVITVLMKRGCSINAQDNHGRTALHVALDYGNVQGVCMLLEAGIDINIVDDDGKNHWEVANRSDKISNILVNHLHKFTLLGLEMSELNRRQYSAMHHLVSSSLNGAPLDSLKEELKLITELKEPIGGFLLSEILSERIFSELYSATSRANLEVILHKLAAPKFRKMFHHFRELMQYQYQRLLERMNLVDSSTFLFHILLGDFLPERCLDRIISFLSNADLRILIRRRQSLQL